MSRIRTLMSAQVHDALDQIEDPAVMAQQLVREVEAELGRRREALVQCLASLRQSERLHAQALGEHARHQRQATQALQAEDENRARVALSRAIAAEKRAAQHQELQERLQQTADAIRSDITQLELERGETMAQAGLIAAGALLDDANKPRSAFAAMRDRQQRLERYSAGQYGDALKIDVELKTAAAAQGDNDVDAALAALKSQLQQELAA